MAKEIGRYSIFCPVCTRHLIKSSESDSEVKCCCGAVYNIWIHDGLICINQMNVKPDRKAEKVKRLKLYEELLEAEYSLQKQGVVVTDS